MHQSIEIANVLQNRQRRCSAAVPANKHVVVIVVQPSRLPETRRKKWAGRTPHLKTRMAPHRFGQSLMRITSQKKRKQTTVCFLGLI